MRPERADPKAPGATFERLRAIGPVLGLVLLCIAGTLLNSDFASLDNAMNVLTRTAFIGIIAVGMCFVIISGGIDLSVGSMAALIAGAVIMFINAMGPALGSPLLAVVLGAVLAVVLVIALVMDRSDRKRGVKRGMLAPRGRRARIDDAHYIGNDLSTYEPRVRPEDRRAPREDELS